MKNLPLIAAIALAACSGSDEAAAPASEETAVETPDLRAMDGGPAYGTFEVTSADGTVLTQVLAADGSQVTTDADGNATPGRFVMEGPERYCRMDGEETEWTCYTEAIGEDGTWTATNEVDPEEVWTIVRAQ